MQFIQFQKSCYSVPRKILLCGYKFEEYTHDPRLNAPIVSMLKYQSLLLKTIFLRKIGVQFLTTQFCLKENKSKTIIHKMKPRRIQLTYV